MKFITENSVKQLLVLDCKYKESHFNTDIKLLLGYIACAFAGYGSLKAYLNPFQETKTIIIISVFGYFLFSGLQAIYQMFIEKNCIFTGKRNDELIQVSFETKKYDDKVKFQVKRSFKRTDKAKITVNEKVISFGSFFDALGTFSPEAFKKELFPFFEVAEKKGK